MSDSRSCARLRVTKAFERSTAPNDGPCVGLYQDTAARHCATDRCTKLAALVAERRCCLACASCTPVALRSGALHNSTPESDRAPPLLFREDSLHAILLRAHTAEAVPVGHSRW